MPITVADGFVDYIREHSGAVHVELRTAEPGATTALRMARQALFRVPHPLEPTDPFVSYASEVREGARRASAEFRRR